jgi:HTH DNA binding domain
LAENELKLRRGSHPRHRERPAPRIPIAARHLAALGLGYRKGRFRWSPHQTLAVRLAGLIEAIYDSARMADGDLKRLTLAREGMARRCAGRRGNSKLQQLVDLFVASPLVTVQVATEKLKVTPQAVEAMLKELGSSLPHEITGRKRYRAWAVI